LLGCVEVVLSGYARVYKEVERVVEVVVVYEVVFWVA